MNINQHQNNGPEGRSNLSPFAFGWLAAAIIITLFTLGGSIVMGLAVDSVSSTGNIDISSRNFFLSAAAGQILFFLIPSLWLAQRHPLGLKEALRLRRPKFSHVTLTLLGIAACYVLGQAWMTAQELYMIPDWFGSTYETLSQNSDMIAEQLLVGKDTALLLLALFTVALVAPVGEEFVFRGIIQRSFEDRLKPFAAMLLAGGLFGFVHLQLNNLIPLIGLGMYLGFVSWASGSIWPAIIGHILFNGSQILLVNLASESSINLETTPTPEFFLEIIPSAFISLFLLVGAIIVMMKTRNKGEGMRAEEC
ncbi:MAG: CPBP family intramembrane metalloprotease [Chlorobi bacterium]|nr:CPBP family intramembrane metalloprotease [Chlorobiota bacterium]